jgi:glycosyltransferase involved in cell wall biosynthesis
VHAHYAAPAADAVRRALPRAPYVVSVHGGDVLAVARRSAAGADAVRRGLEGARLTLANSTGIAERARALGARATRVVHLGTDIPAEPPPHRAGELVTVAHLVARKRHAAVLHALAQVPGVRWTVVGDGPERSALERLAAELGVRDRVEFLGELGHAEAVRRAQQAAAFVLPSVDEAFGVAYVEAMAGGVPAIGTRGEPGPEEIARLGGGMALTTEDALAATIRDVLGDRERLGRAARAMALEHFTWEACGRATVAAYEEALR